MHEANARLAELLGPWMELFDQVFADEPVHRRPLLVAMMLVSEEVITAPGSDESNYLEQEWFGAIVTTTTNWYLTTYGSELLDTPESTVRAAVLIYGSIFEVLVPSNPTRPGQKPGTAIIYFTSGLLPDEDPRKWIRNPPNLDRIDELQAATLQTALIDVCTRTRSVINGLAGADLESERVQALAASITTHIDNAIRGFCEGGAAGKQLAIWELHLAVEKAMKVFILRQGSAPPNTHNLVILERLAAENGLATFSTHLLSLLPSATDAVRYRYGELPTPPVLTFCQWYVAALEVVDHCVNALPRGFFSRHASLIIQALPWHPSRRKAD